MITSSFWMSVSDVIRLDGRMWDGVIDVLMECGANLMVQKVSQLVWFAGGSVLVSVSGIVSFSVSLLWLPPPCFVSAMEEVYNMDGSASSYQVFLEGILLALSSSLTRSPPRPSTEAFL